MKIDVFRGEKFREFDKQPLNTDSTVSLMTDGVVQNV